MEVNPVDVRDMLTLGVFALAIVGLLAISGNVALMDIRRELRRLRRDVRTTTHVAREAAADAQQRAIVVALDPEPTDETE